MTIGAIACEGGVETTGVLGKGGAVVVGVLFGALVEADDRSVVFGLLGVVGAADIDVSVEPELVCVASCDAVVPSLLQPSINTPPKSSTWNPKTQRTATLKRARPLFCCSSNVPCGMSGLELFIMTVALVSVLSCEVMLMVYVLCLVRAGVFPQKTPEQI